MKNTTKPASSRGRKKVVKSTAVSSSPLKGNEVLEKTNAKRPARKLKTVSATQTKSAVSTKKVVSTKKANKPTNTKVKKTAPSVAAKTKESAENSKALNAKQAIVKAKEGLNSAKMASVSAIETYKQSLNDKTDVEMAKQTLLFQAKWKAARSKANAAKLKKLVKKEDLKLKNLMKKVDAQIKKIEIKDAKKSKESAMKLGKSTAKVSASAVKAVKKNSKKPLKSSVTKSAVWGGRGRPKAK
jgi:hypothetical protein